MEEANETQGSEFSDPTKLQKHPPPLTGHTFTDIPWFP